MKIFKKDSKVKKQIRKLAVLKQLKHNGLLNIKDTSDKSEKLLFTKFDINEMILKSLNAMKLTHATKIQGDVIEHALKYRDILASEKTGSGKTLAYLIPLLNLVLKFRFRIYHGTCAIVLVPSKELCIQVCSVFGQLSQFTNVKYGFINGQLPLKEEERLLANGCTVLIATPSSLMNHMNLSMKKIKNNEAQYFRYHNCRYLVLDEADGLMKNSYMDTMSTIFKELPQSRQTLILSATLNLDLEDSLDRINTFAKEALSKQFVRINVPQKSSKGLQTTKNATVDNLIEGYVVVEPSKRILFLYNFLRRVTNKKVMIFLGTPDAVEFYFTFFNLLGITGQTLLMMHSKLSSSLRTSTLVRFTELTSCFMFCTDIVSRGIDIPMVDIVIQFDLPDNLSSYIHRVGRTARGDSDGTAIVVLRPSEVDSVLPNLKKVSVSLVEFENQELAEINDFYQLLPKNSQLVKIAVAALVNQMIDYKKSEVTPDSLEHLDIRQEMVNFCLESLPTIPKDLRAELKIPEKKKKNSEKKKDK